MERSIKARKLSFYTSSSCSMYSYGIKNLKIKLPESDKKKKSSVAPITRYRCLRRRFFHISANQKLFCPLFPQIGMKWGFFFGRGLPETIPTNLWYIHVRVCLSGYWGKIWYVNSLQTTDTNWCTGKHIHMGLGQVNY
jgi:hypothetical protein